MKCRAQHNHSGTAADNLLPDVCRVCRLGEEPDNPLVYPCKCSGSVRFVHPDWYVPFICFLMQSEADGPCSLKQWVAQSQKKHCEICGHKYTFTKGKLHTSEMNLLTFHSLSKGTTHCDPDSSVFTTRSFVPSAAGPLGPKGMAGGHRLARYPSCMEYWGSILHVSAVRPDVGRPCVWYFVLADRYTEV